VNSVNETVQESVRLKKGKVMLEGVLQIPAGSVGAVLFAHGSGSSRHSTRNRAVAAALRRARLGTLLIDLLSTSEADLDARTMHLRFDIARLAERLNWAVDWMRKRVKTRDLPIGLFGASTGAAAALVAAGQRPADVAAVVSRGGPARSGRPRAFGCRGADVADCWGKRPRGDGLEPAGATLLAL
jgi:putative phosphoribosyl transferase